MLGLLKLVNVLTAVSAAVDIGMKVYPHVLARIKRKRKVDVDVEVSDEGVQPK